jgi:hypothetical protein
LHARCAANRRRHEAGGRHWIENQLPQNLADSYLPGTAAVRSHADAELRLGPRMETHRVEFFLATKTGERTRAEAYTEIGRSLDRLRTDRLGRPPLPLDGGEVQQALPRIARDVGKHDFLKHEDDDDRGEG